MKAKIKRLKKRELILGEICQQDNLDSTFIKINGVFLAGQNYSERYGQGGRYKIQLEHYRKLTNNHTIIPHETKITIQKNSSSYHGYITFSNDQVILFVLETVEGAYNSILDCGVVNKEDLYDIESTFGKFDTLSDYIIKRDAFFADRAKAIMYAVLAKELDVQIFNRRYPDIAFIFEYGLSQDFLTYMTVMEKWDRSTVLNYLYPEKYHSDRHVDIRTLQRLEELDEFNQGEHYSLYIEKKIPKEDSFVSLDKYPYEEHDQLIPSKFELT